VRYTAEERLARLLAMIPWIVGHHGPTVVDVCDRFSITPADLAADIGLLYLCGLHPYTPDLLIEAEVRDGRVWVSYAEYFSRPLRLTPVEGLGLLTAAQTLLAVPGTDPAGPLATGLSKLAASLGVDDAVKVDFGSASEDTLHVLRQAVQQGVQVEIDYLSFARNERSVRTVEPDHVFLTQGQWYLSGWCHVAQGERNFRVDRIASASLLGVSRTQPTQPKVPELFTHAPGGGQATIRLAADDLWVIEQYPVIDQHADSEGYLLATFAVTDGGWLDRLVLRISQHSRVVSGPHDWNGAVSAASAVLKRYSAGT
jgi:proteasome accessory factor C